MQSRREQQQQQQQPLEAPAAQWHSQEALFWDHMSEVQNKWAALKLNDDIWAKLIYFEQNRRLAKAYVSTPVLTVDGSGHGLDGFRIGLSGIENPQRRPESHRCLRSIGPGIKLKIDAAGNILVRRVAAPGAGGGSDGPPTPGPVWVRDWSTSGSGGSPESTGGCALHELAEATSLSQGPNNQQDTAAFKLFNMRKFRARLQHLRLPEAHCIDWRQCVSVISFGPQQPQQRNQQPALLEDPCWIMLINIIAIEMIKSSLLAGRVSPPPPALLSSPAASRSRQQNFQVRAQENLDPTGANRGQLAPARSHGGGGGGGGGFLSASLSSNLHTTAAGHQHLSSATSNFNEPSKRMRPSRQRPRPTDRYQSYQQLSAAAAAAPPPSSSSTIYTTFQGKGRHQAPASRLLNRASTSDNFAARHHSQYLEPQAAAAVAASASSRELLRSRERALFSRKSVVLQPGGGGHRQGTSAATRSLSTIDLATFHELPRQRFELRPMQSFIKMNYDHEEDAASGGRSLSAVVEARRGSRTGVLLDGQQKPQKQAESCLCENCKLPIVNRNRKFSKAADKVAGAGASNEPSSVDSSAASTASSSSSGCADNDYFMTQSSASVSSCSAASQEASSSSQPASSSGIVGSENISDEEPTLVVGADLQSNTGASLETQVSPTADQSQQTERTGGPDKATIGKKKPAAAGGAPARRKLDPKTLEPPFDCCCGGALEATLEQEEEEHEDNDSLCPGTDCDCHCYCLCCSGPQQQPLELHQQQQQQQQQVELPDCDCLETFAAAEKRADLSMGGRVHSSSLVALNRPLSRPPANKLTTAKLANKKSSTLDAAGAAPSETSKTRDKAAQPKGGWLQRRNYGKILPKFIFSAGSSSSGAHLAAAKLPPSKKTGLPVKGRLEEVKISKLN